jgi:hypothetical protein
MHGATKKMKEQLLICQLMCTVFVSFLCLIKSRGAQTVHNTEHIQKTRQTTKQNPDPFLPGNNVAQLILGLPNIHSHTSATGSLSLNFTRFYMG